MQLFHFLSLALFAFNANAFQTSSTIGLSSITKNYVSRSKTSLHDTAAEVEKMMKEDYSIFYNLIFQKNKEVWKELAGSTAMDDMEAKGFTIFAPNDAAMKGLGKKRLDQLLDDRNFETAEKMAAYHAVQEPVGAWDLINSAGVKTLGGDVKVGRAKVGGFLGFGGKEDGGITVNGAKILQTKMVDKCTIHEMDNIISPELLWRYMDQLRIV